MVVRRRLWEGSLHASGGVPGDTPVTGVLEEAPEQPGLVQPEPAAAPLPAPVERRRLLPVVDAPARPRNWPVAALPVLAPYDASFELDKPTRAALRRLGDAFRLPTGSHNSLDAADAALLAKAGLARTAEEVWNFADGVRFRYKASYLTPEGQAAYSKMIR